MREVGDVHRELYAKHSDLYGENIAGKVERCLAISDGEYAAAQQARREHAERAAGALEAATCCSTPTLGFVAPAGRRRRARGSRQLHRFTFPFNALGWPALALPCGAAEDGLPASAQIVAGGATTGSCSAQDWRSRRRWAATTAGPSRRAMTGKGTSCSAFRLIRGPTSRP